MTEHLSEEEQLEALKRWWAENGKSTLIGVVLAVSGYLGWEGWQDKQLADAQAASASYNELVEAMQHEPGQPLGQEQATTANHLASELKEHYPSNLYASQAALFKAKLAVEAGDLDAAAAELQWVIERNVDDALTLLTRSRLARVQFDQGDYASALVTVADENSGTFKATFAEIRGDVLLAQGNQAQARAAYQLALENLVSEQARRGALLEMKISDLQNPVVSSSTDQPELPAAQDSVSSDAGEGS